MNELSLTEMKRLAQRIDREIAKRADQTKKNLLKQVQKLAATEGVDLSDLLGRTAKTVTGTRKKTVKSRKATKKGAPIYFNKLDPSKSWSGKGRKPEWVITWLGNGGMLEELKNKP